MKDELQPVKKNKVIEYNPEMLIAQAIDKNVPVETMEKLLAMRRELRAEKAKEEFDKALAKFQEECPTIKKEKSVMDKNSAKVRYKFAPLDSIVSQVKGLLSKNGFSYTMNTVQDEKMLGVVCTATHRSGFSKDTMFSVPIGTESFMSDVQKYGARLTFAKRYAFCNAFGILTGDDDNDATGEPSSKKQIGQGATNTGSDTKHTASDKQAEYIKKLLVQKGYREKDLLAKYEVTDLKQLTSEQASSIIENLMKIAAKKKVVKEEPVEKTEEDLELFERDEELVEAADKALNGSK